MNELLDTTDWRAWIDATLQERRKTRKDLAQALGRSPAWITGVLAGDRPMDPDLLPALARFFDLDEPRESYLAALVDLVSRSPRVRRQAWATVHAIGRHRAAPDRSVEVHRHLNRWYHAAILELVTCEGFRPDPAWIARTLSPPIPVSEAETALSTLVRVGALVPDEEGGLRRDDRLLMTPLDVADPVAARALMDVHRSFFDVAADAIEASRHNERRVANIAMALPEEAIPVFLTRLGEIESELAILASEQPGRPNRVFTLALQLVPVSHYTDSAHLEEPAT